MPVGLAAKSARGSAADGDALALKVFEQQAIVIGRLFTIAAQFTDPHADFVGGGVVETQPVFRSWFVDTVLANTNLRAEQRASRAGPSLLTLITPCWWTLMSPPGWGAEAPGVGPA